MINDNNSPLTRKNFLAIYAPISFLTSILAIALFGTFGFIVHNNLHENKTSELQSRISALESQTSVLMLLKKTELEYAESQRDDEEILKNITDELEEYRKEGNAEVNDFRESLKKIKDEYKNKIPPEK